MNFERVFLLVLTLISAFMLTEGVNLPIVGEYTIGPGFVPCFFLIFLMVLAVLRFFMVKPQDGAHIIITKRGLMRLVAYLCAIAMCIWAMEHFGIIVSLAAFLFGVIYVIERYPALTAAKVSAATSVFIYLLFNTWLGVPITIITFL